MTIAASNAAFLSSTATFLISLLLILQGVSCISRFLLTSHKDMDMVLEDKSRLGSTPPSCHNKCNQCNPCIPVQIPAFLDRSNQMRTGILTRLTDVHVQSFREFSNYKPLGWKCRCHQQLYNP